MSMHIVSAEIKDRVSIMDLISKCIIDMKVQGICQWDEYYPDMDVITGDMEDKTLYTIMEEGKCLGIITLNESQEPEYMDIRWLTEGVKNLVVHRLAVHPDVQRRGIGGRLMDFAEEFALEKGFASIRLDTYSINKRAVNFYESRGYKKCGHVYFNRREHPFYCYEKVL